MNNQKALSIYNEFSEGKFLNAPERMKFPDKFIKFKRFFKKGFPIRKVTNGQKQEKIVNFVDQVNPADISHIIQNLLAWLQGDELGPDEMKDIPKMIMLCPQIKYFQASKHFKAKNENIYVISKRVFDYFKAIPLPENMTYKEITFPREMPALFIFEETGTVVYLNSYDTPDPSGKDLVISLYGDAGIHKYVSMDIIIGTTETEGMADDNLNKQVDFIVPNTDGSNRETYNQYFKFFVNLSLFLSTNDNIIFESKELNQEIITAQENIKNGINIKQNEKIIRQAPSYKFIDLETVIKI